MKIRRLIKKGRVVITRRGNVVINLSKKVAKIIKPYCRRVEVVGSIRRKEKNPVDVDIALIPKNDKDKKNIENVLSKKGKFLAGGNKRATFKIEGVQVELYYTTEDSWGATLLAYSSKFGSQIGLRVVARKKGFKLNQYGLFRGQKKIAGKTEEQIYHALGRPWKLPEER
jgi:DNA polymerase (family X)